MEENILLYVILIFFLFIGFIILVPEIEIVDTSEWNFVASDLAKLLIKRIHLILMVLCSGIIVYKEGKK